MEHDVYSVQSLLARRGELDGRAVVVRGTLAVEPDRAYLVVEPPIDGISRIEVHPSDLGERMLSHVPCRVGGPFYYYDDAEVHAQFTLRDAGQPRLQELSMLVIERGDHRYDVPLAG